MINLTPHTINIVVPPSSEFAIAPSGLVARVATSTVEEATIGGIPFFSTAFGEVEIIDQHGIRLGADDQAAWLAAIEDGAVVITSALVKAPLAALLPQCRVVSPGGLVRDAAGAVIGCNGLTF